MNRKIAAAFFKSKSLFCFGNYVKSSIVRDDANVPILDSKTLNMPIRVLAHELTPFIDFPLNYGSVREDANNLLEQ